MCECSNNVQTEEIVEVKTCSSIVGITCSLSCNHEEHERTGYSTKDLKAFVDVFSVDSIQDGMKRYIDLQDTMF